VAQGFDTPGEDAREVIALRPIATPFPLGFIGLAVATTLVAALELSWVPPTQALFVGVGILAFTVPLQAVGAIFGVLARDPVAGTGVGVLAATWASIGVMTVLKRSSAALDLEGILLLVAAAALLVPATTALSSKVVPAAVLLVTALRFALTGLYQLTGAEGVGDAAGLVGLVLAALALYAALALELESARGHAVLPVLRRGDSASLEHEPGVRAQL
jgi:succinate-acetate transporter protein